MYGESREETEIHSFIHSFIHSINQFIPWFGSCGPSSLRCVPKYQNITAVMEPPGNDRTGKLREPLALFLATPAP